MNIENEIAGYVSQEHSNDYLSDGERECQHDLDEDGICKKCACRPIQLSMDSELKFYNKSRSKNETSRCQLRKIHVKTLAEDLSHTGIPSEVLDKIDELYHKVVNGKVYRGQIRLAIALVLIRNYYMYELNEPIDPDSLTESMGVIKSKINVGKKIYNNFIINNPEYKQKHRYPTPLELVPNILKKLGKSLDHLQQIKKIYDQISKSVYLSSSKPQSLATAIVYYYFSTLINKDSRLIKKDYCETVGVSEITISKIFKEIKSALDTSIINERKIDQTII